MKGKILSLTLVILSTFICVKNTLSWDNDTTHMQLSEFAAESSILDKNKGDYLKNLGFIKALDEELKWSTTKLSVKKWIAEGANLEDIPVTRSFNHFHNPTKPWDQAGLDDWIFLPPFYVAGQSSLLWVQDTAKQSFSFGGDWSWQKVREHYYTALTGKDFTGTVIALNKEERDAYFARTFRGLGQQIHLIEDAAQPDHVRNDAHPEDSMFEKDRRFNSFYFETWAKKNTDFIKCLLVRHDSLPPEVLSECQKYNISESVNIGNYMPKVLSLNPSELTLDPSYYNKGLEPIALLLDTDQYNGGNPSTSLSLGIAEYTNANFASDDTIFTEDRSTTDRHYFPYPRKSSTDLQYYIEQNKLPETILAEDGIPDTSFWIKKIKDGETIEHFVRPGYLTNIIGDVIGVGTALYERTFYRDEKCHEDYAQKLIPPAVGYSAGLLNYFFRGEMDMVPDNATGSGYVIVNNTDEDMSGTFELWYDNKDDERIKVSGASWTLSINKKSSGIFSYRFLMRYMI